MPEVWTDPFVATTNEIIASSDANAGYRGNLLYFRQFLTNPGGANLPLVSTGANGASWMTLGTDGITDQAVTTAKIANFTIIAGDIAANAIETAKINDGAVTEPKLAMLNAPSDDQVLVTVSGGSMQWQFILEDNIFSEAVTEPKLSMRNAPSDNQVIVFDTADSRMFWDTIRPDNITAEAITEPKLDSINAPSNGQFLQYVSASSRMQWNDAVPNDSVTESKLDVSNSPTDGHLLAWNTALSKFQWVAPPSGTAGVPSGLIAFFISAAALAAASGWAAYTAAAGRILACTGQVFGGPTFTDAGNFGSSWDHAHTGNTWTGGTGGGTGTGSTATGTTGPASAETANLRTVTPEEADAATKDHTHSIPSLGVTVSSLSVTGVTISGNTTPETYVPPIHSLPMGQKS